MKKTLITMVFVLLIAAILSGMSFAGVYSKNGITLTHPDGWSFEEQVEPELLHGMVGASPEGYVLCFVVCDDPKLTPAMVKEFYNGFLEGEKAVKVSESNYSEVILGSNATGYVSNIKFNGTNYESKGLGLTLRGKTVFIVKQVPVKSKDQGNTVLNSIISTVKFK